MTQTNLVSRVAIAQKWPKQLPSLYCLLDLPAVFDSVYHCILLFILAWASLAAHLLGLTLTYLGVHSGHLLVPLHQGLQGLVPLLFDIYKISLEPIIHATLTSKLAPCLLLLARLFETLDS